MRIVQIETGGVSEIKEHGGTDVFLSSIVEIEKSTAIHWMSFDPYSSISGHYLSSPQIFLVVGGEGWVRSDSPEPIPVETGDAVFWNTGEWCEAGSEGGMNVILIESKLPDPLAFSKHR